MRNDHTTVTHSPLIDLAATRVVGCTCGWKVPQSTGLPIEQMLSITRASRSRRPAASVDSDTAYATHLAISTIATLAVDDHVDEEGRGQMTKEPGKSMFNGVKIISATMIAQRQMLGEAVTAWLEDARARRPGFQLVDVQVMQSSDEAFHCISFVITFNEDLHASKEKQRRVG